jgi:uncharacterized metal-binding protein YceD (DUF177 family)
MPGSHHAAAVEFSRPVDTARLKGEEAVHDIAATAAERAALARRFGLEALDRLEARVRLCRMAGGYVRLAAELSADVVQTCVATLEPVAGRVEDAFTLLYGAVEAAGEVVLDNDAETVEPLQGETIDIGEAVAQQLSLALDPYPRAPEASAAAAGEPAAAPQDSPFAVLASLARKG